ncbi:hypothetical protein BB561_004604 [Smittium simulii]|uniref:Rad21/Rec8-like protein N-terminal domain-containing protein n=1 Tax=Smittium simulii TaxID=133385 RepID=A0A2T9YFF4_9FUNG|nr:hypothetical protein BB561_004604 [Smittium simulii]
MFFSDTVLLKKGPLAKVWLAAHLEKKMNKAQFIQTSIVNSVSTLISSSQPPLALRLSGQLLLGMARIYSRKAKYLLEDCTEALLKIRMAFRAGGVDLIEATVAQRNAITLPEALTEFDVQLPNARSALYLQDIDFLQLNHNLDDNIFGKNIVDNAYNNVSALRDITLPDESMDASMIARRAVDPGVAHFGEELLGHDDGFNFNFGDDWLNEPGSAIGSAIKQPLDGSNMDIEVARRASLLNFNEPSIFDGVSDLKFDEKGNTIDQKSFLSNNLENFPSISIGNLGFGDGSEIPKNDLFGVFGAGMQFENSMGLVPNLQLDELGWDQAEADILLNPHADDILAAQKKKRKRDATLDLVDEETIYPISKLRETFLDPSSLLLPPTYLPIISNSHNASDFNGGAMDKLFGIPDELDQLFEHKKLLPVEYLIAAQRNFFESSNKLDGSQLVPGEVSMQSGWDGLFEPGSGIGIDTELRIPGDSEEFKIDEDSLNFDEAPMVLADGSIMIPEEAKQLTAADITFGDTEFDLQLKSIMDNTDVAVDKSVDAVPLFSETTQTQQSESILKHKDDSGLSGLGFSKTTIEAVNILNKKSVELYPKISLKNTPDIQPVLQFNDVTANAPKTDIVKMFFEVLVLKSQGFIDTEQEKPFGDIQIKPLQKLYQAAQ